MVQLFNVVQAVMKVSSWTFLFDIFRFIHFDSVFQMAPKNLIFYVLFTIVNFSGHGLKSNFLISQLPLAYKPFKETWHETFSRWAVNNPPHCPLGGLSFRTCSKSAL